jgi:predicted transcriptional regulator
VRHVEEQLRYTYLPATPRQTVRKSALRHLIDTFFEGSPEGVVEALVRDERRTLSTEELDRIARVIEQARREGRRR